MCAILYLHFTVTANLWYNLRQSRWLLPLKPNAMKCFIAVDIMLRSTSVVSLLGLLAKIKCSICSYQFNIWYTAHRVASILNWFLAFGLGCGACFSQAKSPPRIAVPRGWAHLQNGGQNKTRSSVNIGSGSKFCLLSTTKIPMERYDFAQCVCIPTKSFL